MEDQVTTTEIDRERRDRFSAFLFYVAALLFVVATTSLVGMLGGLAPALLGLSASIGLTVMVWAGFANVIANLEEVDPQESSPHQPDLTSPVKT